MYYETILEALLYSIEAFIIFSPFKSIFHFLFGHFPHFALRCSVYLSNIECIVVYYFGYTMIVKILPSVLKTLWSLDYVCVFFSHSTIPLLRYFTCASFTTILFRNNNWSDQIRIVSSHYLICNKKNSPVTNIVTK